MTKWPLHPFKDLNGYVSDLVENQYEASLLHKLGIDYNVLLENNMTCDWMKMFRYSVKEWALLGFSVHLASK